MRRNRRTNRKGDDERVTRSSKVIIKSGGGLATALYLLGVMIFLPGIAYSNPPIAGLGLICIVLGGAAARTHCICNTCGNTVAPSSTLCPACGSLFDLSRKEQEAAAADNRNWLNAILYTVVILACIAAGLALAYWLLTLGRTPTSP